MIIGVKWSHSFMRPIRSWHVWHSTVLPAATQVANAAKLFKIPWRQIEVKFKNDCCRMLQEFPSTQSVNLGIASHSNEAWDAWDAYKPLGHASAVPVRFQLGPLQLSRAISIEHAEGRFRNGARQILQFWATRGSALQWTNILMFRKALPTKQFCRDP